MCFQAYTNSDILSKKKIESATIELPIWLNLKIINKKWRNRLSIWTYKQSRDKLYPEKEKEVKKKQW